MIRLHEVGEVLVEIFRSYRLASAERALHLEIRSCLGVARIVAMRKVWIASVLNRQPVSEKLQREQQREGAQRLLLSLDLNSDIDRHGQHRTEPGIESKAFCADFSQRFGHLFRTSASRRPPALTIITSVSGSTE